jgi:RNA recognition motif-containing protein
MRTLYVGGLPPETDTRALRGLFAQYGELSDARVVMRSGVCRGFGYVTFSSDSSAAAARAALDGASLGGGQLRVAEAR